MSKQDWAIKHADWRHRRDAHRNRLRREDAWRRKVRIDRQRRKEEK